MRTDRPLLRRWTALAAAVLLLGGCNTARLAVSEGLGDGQASAVGGAIGGLAGLPFASAYVRSGRAYEGFVVLGDVDARGVQTWYGKDGLLLQLDGAHVVRSRGLPVDIAETHAAAAALTYDCGDGLEYQAGPALHYARLGHTTDFIAEIRESLSCRIEPLATPAYAGDALRIDELYRIAPHPRTQLRSVWLHPRTRELLRLEYAEHPLAPEISILWVKPVAVGSR